jgi:hypothetical protein
VYRSPNTLCRLFAAAALLAVGQFCCADTQADREADPIRVEPIELMTAAGTVRGHLATINLAHPDVQIVTTAALAPDTKHPERAEAALVSTDAWAIANKVDLAINANYFANLKPETDGDDKPAGTISAADRIGETKWSDILGLSISDGKVVSPARLFRDQPDPVLLISTTGIATIETLAPDRPERYSAAVAGIGASDKESTGTLLVTNGMNTGATARVGAKVRHPRTAAGVGADGHTLLLVVIDGRQPDWSVGITLPDLADFLITKGAANALNLDGGGSSSFVYYADGPASGAGDSTTAPARRRIVNRPSDGSFRPVANHLGVRIARRPALRLDAPDGSVGVESARPRP